MTTSLRFWLQFGVVMAALAIPSLIRMTSAVSSVPSDGGPAQVAQLAR